MIPARTVYREPGVRWGAVLWGPAFALAGFLAELAAGGPLHTVEWLLVAAGLTAITAPWVYARRRFLSVRVTTRALWQGREELPVERIADLSDEVGTPAGARVLGGGWTVPRKYDEVPLKLDDGTVVLAWARHGLALREALHEVVSPGGSPDVEDSAS